MNYNAYEILGLPTNASMEQVESRYKELRAQYQRDRFLPGEEGEEACERLQQIEVAYRDILTSREEQNQSRDFFDDNDYTQIQELISTGRLEEAQALLDERSVRDAEWHYIQSILFYKRNWFLESKKQLELACQMDPNNARYRQSLEKLTRILASNTISPDQMRTTSRPTNDNYSNMGAGNGTCTGSSCGDCLLCNACCNCMQCMGGGC
ncbi:MAG: J domain-containing protein [Clostridia bacterium]|nr:J domain-containing protein [Clostridia bacterium]MBQ8505742.1 J domain-containing protein [Clostridia bacterium]MBQ8873371.1 J domain-containing protein [Clostridia bacterium]MBQ9706799.1 J domain-containing protein [Clostridia bacterium]